jgi:hypothetical protein
MITDYTSYAEIRAALGVSSKELPDATLALPLYETILLQDIGDASTTVDAAYLVVAALPSINRTPNQVKLYTAMQAFAAYQTASNLLSALPLFAPQAIKDGRAELARQDDPFAETREGVMSMLSKLRKRLIDAEAVLANAQAVAYTLPYAFTSAVGLGTDPVTGT